MRKLLLSALFLMPFINYAQFTEDFEGEVPGWTFINQGDAGTWSIIDLSTSEITAHDGVKIASILYDETTAHDDFLISPAITVTAGVSDHFSFYARSRDANFPETVSLVLSTTTATAAEDFSVTLIASVAPESGANFHYFEADLSDYVGQTVYVAFHSETLNMFAFDIDTVVVDGAVAGINENPLSNLSVFPNPANDIVNVTVDALVDSVSITDLNGRTVKSVSFDGVSNASVNIADLASGMYMMNITSDKGMTTKKIMKN